MNVFRDLRSADWLLIVYFFYVAAIWPWHPVRWLLAVGVAVLLTGLVWLDGRVRGTAVSIFRDWVALGLTLAAYREMDWFTPAIRDHHLERVWVVWDRVLLHQQGLQSAIESTGALLPSLLEICYGVVYAAGPFALATLYVRQKRDRANRFLSVYLVGTLLAYALFPYFPSEPPRTAFAGADLPRVLTVFRRFNLWILGGYGIHSSVFPSAHVSSAFSAAWGLLLTLPDRPRIGWAMCIYAVLVAVATVYGRYHYAADAVAGFGVSLVALGAGRLFFAWQRS
ncbi:MAG: phosphatase PAP2 family protein [Bryobacteraceae bacterium]